VVYVEDGEIKPPTTTTRFIFIIKRSNKREKTPLLQKAKNRRGEWA